MQERSSALIAGRGDEIRTRDPHVPNVVLYQAELHPDYESAKSTTICCGKLRLGQIVRSVASNSRAILLKRPKNLSQADLPSLRSTASGRLQARILTKRTAH